MNKVKIKVIRKERRKSGELWLHQRRTIITDRETVYEKRIVKVGDGWIEAPFGWSVINKKVKW